MNEGHNFPGFRVEPLKDWRDIDSHVEQLRGVAARVGGSVSLCGDELVVEIPEERRKEFDLLLRSLKL